MKDTVPHRTYTASRQPLERGADGKLRRASDGHEIGDIWAQQRRIQLNEAIAESRRQTVRERLRRERGLVGLAKVEFHILVRRAKLYLFGTRSLAATPRPQQPLDKHGRQTATANGPAGKPAGTATRNIDITINLPKIPRTGIMERLGKLRDIRRPRRPALIALAAILVAGAGVFMYTIRSGPSGTEPAPGAPHASSGPAVLERGTPDYPTLLPAGKSIESLGGWTRISPPDRDPAYAYVDTVDGISISVSQQPLPIDFRHKTADKVEQLAKSYTANQKLTAGSTTVYIGTSTKGPQSVIFSRDDILILIKSTAPIAADSWTKYIASLQ